MTPPLGFQLQLGNRSARPLWRLSPAFWECSPSRTERPREVSGRFRLCVFFRDVCTCKQTLVDNASPDTFTQRRGADITCSGFPTKCVISGRIVSDRLIARGIKGTLLVNYAGRQILQRWKKTIKSSWPLLISFCVLPTFSPQQLINATPKY